jgi:hypothetical protein
MRSGKPFARSFSNGPICWLVVLVSFLGGTCVAAQGRASDSICASVVEIQGTVESGMPGGTVKLLEPGDLLQTGEELNLKAGSWAVLTLADSTIRKFTGPATIVLKTELPANEGSLLSRLSSAIVDLLLSEESSGGEAMMATRQATRASEGPMRPVVLLTPAPGSCVLEGPAEFKWQRIEGVPNYHVSVYAWDGLMWQDTTSEDRISCPAGRCHFQPGERYNWVVEAPVGNSMLKSQAGEFEVLSADDRSRLLEALDRADASLADSDLRAQIKIRLCLNSGVWDKALDLVRSHWKEGTLDRQAYLLRASIEEKMGLFEDALLDYKNASRMSSAR